MKSELIFGQDAWQKYYFALKTKDQVFIFADLVKAGKVYLTDYNSYAILKNYCKENEDFVKSIGLQFRSHTVKQDVASSSNGVYLSKSIIGQMGGTSKKCYTIGIVNEHNAVAKKTYTLPELIERPVSYGKIEDCFEEGLIYNVEKSKAV
jgi:hypothetical protein